MKKYDHLELKIQLKALEMEINYLKKFGILLKNAQEDVSGRLKEINEEAELLITLQREKGFPAI